MVDDMAKRDTASGKHPLGTPGPPTTVILFGATGDLSKRKLLPGLLHLLRSGLLPNMQVLGTSLEEHTRDSFIEFAHAAVTEHGDEVTQGDWDEFAKRLFWAGPPTVDNLTSGLAEAEAGLAEPQNRLAYLSVPPKAALAVISTLGEAGLVEGTRIIMEKPFGTDLESAKVLNAALHAVFDETQIFRIDHFLGKEAALNILAFRFANGLFEPIWHRNMIDHVQIDVPEKLGLESRAEFYEATGAYRDMVVTHLFQVLAFTAMEAPTGLDPDAITVEKNKVFRSMLPIQPVDVVRGQYDSYQSEPGVASGSETETFIALRCFVDNWRWADVPFYLRTGKKMAEGQRIISIAFKEPPQSMFPEGSGIGQNGPDHLTFDLADSSKMSLSFYGKRPGPDFRLDKLSMQFSVEESAWSGSVLEAYERLILDAVKGNHTLFTTADGVERLWEISQPLLDNLPPVRTYPDGSWGPNQIHQLIAPRAWRLPFERKWRDKK
ncbi:putative glucose-6-phosphate 1-dehydrogenase [metagenome]|uniref:Putative glucose-6-phosphate 1-dehydrogenase n=1 Tax=metagenome TaxID=256318 RepID=A0A2P2BYT8_9ZZZZ